MSSQLFSLLSSLLSPLSSRSSHLSSSRLSPNSHILLLTRSSFSLYRPDFPIFFAPLLQPLISFSCFSPLISPPPLLPIFECCYVSRHQGDTHQVAFSFLFSSLLLAPLTLLNSHFWPLFSSSPLFSSLAFLSLSCFPSFFASLPAVGCLALFSLSTHVASISSSFLPVRLQASGDNFLAANFEDLGRSERKTPIPCESEQVQGHPVSLLFQQIAFKRRHLCGQRPMCWKQHAVCMFQLVYPTGVGGSRNLQRRRDGMAASSDRHPRVARSRSGRW